MLAPLMFLHGLLSVELLVANVALERSVISVGPFVDPQISLLSVLLATDFAGEGLLSRVSDQMPLHCRHADEPFTADRADWEYFRRSFSDT